MDVRIENLTKTFVGKKGVETTAVDKMSFTIPDGKLVGLLGPSGCGKSTTLYMIAGLHKPTGGRIWFGDEDVTNVPPENRGIGLVFQNYALYPHLSVRQNIEFPLDNVRFPGPYGEEENRVLDARADEKSSKADLAKSEKLLEKTKKQISDLEIKVRAAKDAGDSETEERLGLKVENGKKRIEFLGAHIESVKEHLAFVEKEIVKAEEALEKAKQEYEELKAKDPEAAKEKARTKLSNTVLRIRFR